MELWKFFEERRRTVPVSADRQKVKIRNYEVRKKVKWDLPLLESDKRTKTPSLYQWGMAVSDLVIVECCCFRISWKFSRRKVSFPPFAWDIFLQFLFSSRSGLFPWFGFEFLQIFFFGGITSRIWAGFNEIVHKKQGSPWNMTRSHKKWPKIHIISPSETRVN